MSNLFALSKTFDINPNKHIIMAGDFNLFFNSKLGAAAGIPSLKRNSLAKLIELKETYDKLLVLFNADLITFFISNGLQEFASTTDTLAPISTNHSPSALLSFTGKS